MQLGIIGLPQSGKSTVFASLTGRQSTQTIASVKVPDPRLDVLARMFNPKKVTPAEVSFVELADSGRGFGEGAGWTSDILEQMRKMDALVYVVRAFENPTVAHFEGSVDPERDIATMNLEMTFADMALIEKRIERIGAAMKSANAAEREKGDQERKLMEQLMAGLEKEAPIRDQPLKDADRRAIDHYKFLTQMPLLTVVNIGEDQLDQATDFEEKFSRPDAANELVTALSGKIEMDLAQMDEGEAREFRDDLGLEEPGLHRAIRLAYQLLGYISFLTTGEDEVRAWAVQDGATAPVAAGRIHTDIQRGFIRAEIVGYDELVAAGGLKEAKKLGVLRLEGKTYTVADGDIINFLFNV